MLNFKLITWCKFFLKMLQNFEKVLSLRHQQVLNGNQCDLKLKNEDEQTPLHLAAKYGRTRVVTWICKLDCDIVKDEDEDSNTPLHIAAIEGHVKVCSNQSI